MIPREDFHRWFNKSFWAAFKTKAFPITLPKTKQEQVALVEKVYASIVSARYAPGIPETEVIINKGHGVARTVPVFCIEDCCVYYFCIKELEDILCDNRTPNTFGGWRLGGSLRKQENSEIECELTDYGRYSFNPHGWTQAFGEFNSLLFSQLDQRNFSHVLQFDLSNFYDSVRLDILERRIREKANGIKGWIIALLFFLLSQWNRHRTGLHPQAVGLPQDALADCSRILSNFYLQNYDKFAAATCTNAGALYFRYSDDQMILLNDPNHTEKLLLLLTRKLDQDGLRVNQKKVDLWKADDLQKHRCREIQAIFAEKGDNKDPRLIKNFVEAYLSVSIDDLQKTWNHGHPLLNRLLHAKLEQLPKKTFDNIVTRLLSEPYLLVANHKRLERIHDLNAKTSKPIDLDKRLIKLGKRSVHNSYHHEVLAFSRAKGNTDLAAYFTLRIQDLEKFMAKE